MVNQINVFTATINGIPYNLLCSPSAPIIDLKEALFQITKMVGDVEEKLKQSQIKNEADELPKQEVSDVQLPI